MGVFAKIGNLKRQAGGQDVTLNYEEIKASLQSPEVQTLFSSLGISQSGITEISNGNSISQPEDRMIVSTVLSICADAIIKKGL